MIAEQKRAATGSGCAATALLLSSILKKGMLRGLGVVSASRKHIAALQTRMINLDDCA
jgi:hypothetical protein